MVQQEDTGSATPGDPGAIPGESTSMNSPVVQRQRLLAYTQATMVQVRPGLLDAQVRQLAERLGLNPSDCRFDSCSGHMTIGSVGNWQTTLA